MQSQQKSQDSAPGLPWRGCIAIFLLSAVLLGSLIYGSGLDTLEVYLHHHWQIVDLQAIRHSLVDAIIHQHSQPPLFSLVIWLADVIFGDMYHGVVNLNILFASITSAAIFAIIHGMTRSARLAAAGALLHTASPATLLYCTYAFYPTLTCMLYTLLLLAFTLRSLRHAMVLLVAATTALTLLRSSFTPLHAALLIVLLACLRRLSRRQLATCLLASLVMTSAIPLKNLFLYGFFGQSSWQPLNMAKGLDIALPYDYFPSPPTLARTGQYRCDKHYSRIDSAPLKADGYPNYNSCLILAYAQETSPRLVPGYSLKKHLHRVLIALGAYLSPPQTYMFLTNRPAIAAYDRLFAAVHLNVDASRFGKALGLRLGLVVAVAGLLWGAAVSRNPLLLAACITFLVHLCSHVLTDGTEANRFVYDLDALIPIGYAFLAHRLMHAGKAHG